MRGRPDGGMYGIKLIYPGHLDYPAFTEDFDGTDGRTTLMNFRRGGPGARVAAGIPVGHRALVYVTRWQRFIWAIEFTGTLADGERSKAAHGATDEPESEFPLMRPIRIYARVADPKSGPTRAEVFERSGVVFQPNSYTHKYISADDFRHMYDAIPWDQER